MKKIKLLALVVAVATALGMFLFLNSINQPAKTSKTSVVVATMNIASNTTITNDMIKMSDIPTEALTPNAMTDSALVVGSILNANAVSGEQIISSRLVKVGQVSSNALAYAVKPDMRAITIGVDNISGLSGMIKPENMVDIIAQFQAETKILVQNIKVLAVDQVMSKDSKTTTANYSTITLEVTPDQAVKLSFSAKNASLQVILRSPLDDKSVAIPNVTQKDVDAN